MQYIGLKRSVLLLLTSCGLGIFATAQTVPSQRRISPNCRNPSNTNLYCNQSPIGTLDTEPVLRAQLDSLVGQELYTCGRYIDQVAEVNGALYRALQGDGNGALPVTVKAFEPLKIYKIYSNKVRNSRASGSYIVVKLKSDVLGAIRSDAHTSDLGTSEDPMYLLLRNLTERVYSDLTKTPFTQAEIDAIEQHDIEVGTAEPVAQCILGTPIAKDIDDRHRTVYLYQDGSRVTMDNGHVVAMKLVAKR